jgi:hypothetical protein
MARVPLPTYYHREWCDVVAVRGRGDSNPELAALGVPEDWR